MDMALDKQCVLLRIKPAGNILRKLHHRAPAQFRRILADSDAVFIHNAVIAGKLIRDGNPVFNRTEVVAEVKITGRLYPGKHYFFHFCRIIHKNAFLESVIVPFILSEEVQLDNSQFYLYYI
jgi:hypothetical protein